MSTATRFNCNLTKQLQDNVIDSCNMGLSQKSSPHDHSQRLNFPTYHFARLLGLLIKYQSILLELTKMNQHHTKGHYKPGMLCLFRSHFLNDLRHSVHSQAWFHREQTTICGKPTLYNILEIASTEFK